MLEVLRHLSSLKLKLFIILPKQFKKSCKSKKSTVCRRFATFDNNFNVSPCTCVHASTKRVEEVSFVVESILEAECEEHCGYSTQHKNIFLVIFYGKMLPLSFYGR